jgi:hypothetical protein
MSAPSFSKKTPNKISKFISVSGKNILIKTDDDCHRVAIADEPIDAKIDGKKFFCVRIENEDESRIMLGFTPKETFDSKKVAHFGWNGFTGCGISLYSGNLSYPGSDWHNIIDRTISRNAKEIIVILTISNNGTKKEIQVLCDGIKTESTDVSRILKGDFLFPAISLFWKGQSLRCIQYTRKAVRPSVKHGGCFGSVTSFGKVNESQQFQSMKSKIGLKQSRISSRNIENNKIVFSGRPN